MSRERVRKPHSADSLAVLVVAAALLAATAAAAQYQIVTTSTTEVGPLERSEWAVAPSLDPIETFEMTRWVSRDPGPPARGAVLFLPSLDTTFALYEQRDPNGAIGTSMAEFFALRGYDVYGYSPRFEGLPAGACEAGVLDCSAMANWDLQSMLDDIAFVRDRIEELQPGIDVVAGGLSLGGILAVAVANADGGRYAGVFPWEGMLLSDDPAVQTLNTGYCAAIEAQLSAGVVFDGVGTGVFTGNSPSCRSCIG